jgi:[ribosomal protein S18]-alanine N-acetyltransferase
VSVRIVQGSADDLDSVMEVMSAAFPARYGEAWTRSQCAGILPMTGVRLFLAQDAKGSVGFSLYRTIAGDAELLLLAVDPKAQRKGIGRKLLDHFIQDARNSGAERIHLEVRDGNAATQLYEGAGFTQVHRRRNYYRGTGGTHFDALTFVWTTSG